MNCNLSYLICCLKPQASAQFQHTTIEFSDDKAYMDVFVSVDGTVIRESDFLYVSEEGLSEVLEERK